MQKKYWWCYYRHVISFIENHVHPVNLLDSPYSFGTNINSSKNPKILFGAVYVPDCAQSCCAETSSSHGKCSYDRIQLPFFFSGDLVVTDVADSLSPRLHTAGLSRSVNFTCCSSALLPPRCSRISSRSRRTSTREPGSSTAYTRANASLCRMHSSRMAGKE